MKYLFSILALACILSSCSEYQKVLKSEDIALKFKVGDSLFQAGKYEKANRLFAQIVPKYKGKPQAEKLMYLYSKSYYETKDYYVSGYQFERFAASYPKSEKREEASFLSAKSYYMLSPVYSKDQKETKDAIEKLQEFINLYPNSQYVAEANTLIKELDFKLEKKAFEIAKQYDLISDYKASIKSFDNFIFEFPGSSLREDALFYRLDAAYKLAVNSIEIKRTAEGIVRLKKNRLEQAKEYFNTLKKAYPNSEYMARAQEMVLEINEELETYSAKS
ncbi:outer membrane protein assembly factor BamD [Jejuia pallidilutea]|uniref:Beta-barrel assembly machine subunit BamD n=1 Tax=Jejuia pallidilutea TaxID=504487 RepID=A0A090VQY3_9FLAO|nr:outer membrane protein assembly factor BamD [Jejuia pallidilutea]PQV50496.1 Beta-barrel assembly machine subunit BamD [Jejuia pallidilutea]GAL65739.1 lipoprotein protein putative [Jejuia pallidilutea]GAL72834.1 lipoprotein protein putative [Jejuia pallidilutea]GAL88599.1 lipoprotein protein putative [Jejuia pallidilutea]